MNPTAKRGLLVAGAACASLALMSGSASATTYLDIPGRGYGVISTGGTFAGACDMFADNWGVRTQYTTSNGVTDIVGDANGSAAGCGGEAPTGGGYIVRARTCAGVNGAGTSCTAWDTYPW
ncbi:MULTISPECIES: hypothetical protein [Streptomyces]|uniref:Secreted protein n=2 Tax=Streptomyces TaxID=1883 RepID=A0ABV9J3F0_9ACTN